jgi:CHAT domain-containing protein/tetratricopeptide (TPR) repeat protein
MFGPFPWSEWPQRMRWNLLRRSILLALVTGASAGTLYAGTEAAKAPLVLQPGAAATEISVAPSATVDFTVPVPAGRVVVLTLTEERQTSSVVWTDADGKVHIPRTNMAGKGARIRFTLEGGASSQRFSLRATNAKRGSTLRAWASAPRQIEARDAVAVAAEEFLAKGESLWEKHDAKENDEALSAFDDAIADWKQISDVPMLRRSLTWKAIYLSFAMGEARMGLPLLREATALPDAGDTVEQANSWKTLGFVQTELADYAAGWDDYAKALALFKTTGDRFNQEVLLENRGDLSKATGDYEGALKDTVAASQIARELNDRIGVLHIEDEIGGIYLQRGEMQSAFEAYEQVLGLEQIYPGDTMIGFAETDLARLYHELNANARSRDMLARANAFWAAHPYLLGQLHTLIEQGRMEADTGDLAQAEESYAHGLKLATPAKMKREMVFYLLGLGTVQRERKENAAAAASFDQALQLAAAIDEFDALAQIHMAEGDLAMDEGHVTAARKDYESALEVATRSYDHAATIRALGGLAHAEFRSGDFAAANHHIEMALDGIESTRDLIVPGSLQTGYFSSWHSYYSLAIQVQMRLAALHPRAEWEQKALATAERGRARFLLDQLEAGGGDVEAGADEELADSRAQTLRELHLAESSLVALRTKGRNSARVKRLQGKVAALEEREDGIEAAIYRKSPPRRSVQDAAWARTLPDILPEIQSRMGAHTALLEYWTDARASYLWVVTAKSLHSFTLPGAAELRPLTARMTTELAAPFARTPASVQQFAAELSASTADFNAASRRLAHMVLPAHAIPAATHTLVVVGDGPLLSVPFEALRIGVPGKRAAYLQDDYSVVREPSIGVLLALLGHPQVHQPLKVAVIADPVFRASDPRLAGRGVRVADPAPVESAERGGPPAGEEGNGGAGWMGIAGMDHLRRLTAAHREAEDIAAIVGRKRTDLALGFAASVADVRSMDWGKYTIAHFATHSFLNPGHPELASVALSMYNSGGRPQAGLLWYSDVSSLHMPVQMVVLSACRTANGESMPGEGLVGLSYAFFLAGARRVVGTLWDTDDEATEALMRRFYAALISGSASPADALRAAQREMAATPRWSDPYYWAGFSIGGDLRALPQ